MIDPNNPPVDLHAAVVTLQELWNKYDLPAGTKLGGFMRVYDAETLADQAYQHGRKQMAGQIIERLGLTHD